MRKMKKTIVALTCLGLAFAGAGVLQATSTKTVQAEGNSNFACAGASIRLDSNTDDGDDRTGIRFRVKMENETLATATANGGEVRILVMPTDLLGDGVLDLNDTGARDEALTAWADFVEDNGESNTSYKQAYAYTYGMTEAEWNRPTTWRAYYMNGETPVYSDQMERSLSQVALSCEQDETETNEDRKEKAGAYILNYTVTYDHGVRDTDGNWKTTTQTVRFGSALTENAPEAREDFEFLAWETTKGADKLKAKGETTVVTGNVTKEAYWLLTGGIDITNVKTMEEYADFTPNTYANGDAISTVADTTNGLTFQSKWNDVSASSKFIYMDWKNICVPANIVYRMKGKQSTTQRDSDSAHGTLYTYFLTETNPTELYRANQTAFDNFATFDSTKFTAYSDYYVLGDFYAVGNAVSTQHTTSFEKFQIQSADYYTDQETHDASSLECLGGATSWQLDKDDDITTQSAYVSDSYLICNTSAQGNKTPLSINYNSISLAQNDKICITIKATKPIHVGVNQNWTGNSQSTFNADAAVTCDEFTTYIITAKKAITLSSLEFRNSYNTATDFVIHSIEIKPAACTGETLLCLAGLNEGAKTVTYGGAAWMTPVVTFGTDETNGDYVKYTFGGNYGWGVDALTFDFGGITLNAGDTVYINAYVAEGGRWPEIWVNGTKTSAFLTHATDNKKNIYTATESTTLNTVAIHPQQLGSGYTPFEITIYDLYIVRAN